MDAVMAVESRRAVTASYEELVVAHPVVEAVYLGLLAVGATQSGEAPKVAEVEPVSAVECPCVTTRTPRVVYDWAGGSRTIYRSDVSLAPAGAERVGANENGDSFTARAAES